MKIQGNEKFSRLFLVLLLILNISALITMGFHVWESKKSVSVTSVTPNNSFNGKYFKDNLQLTDSQMVQFRDLNATFRQKAGQINQKLVENRKAMMNEMESETADTLLLKSLSENIGKLHTELKVCTYTYYLDIKGICNPGQQTRLIEIFKPFFLNESPSFNQGNQTKQNRFQNGKRKN